MSTTTAKKPATPKAPADPLKDHKDADGNLINPPTIPEFESRLVAAHDRGDDLLIQEVTEEYNAERLKVATANLKREQKRAKLARENS